jgi:hypothetical protein
MFYGERWQFRKPDDVEPSDVYVAYTRGVGVVLVVAAIGLVIAHFTLQAHADNRVTIAEAWDVQEYRADEIQAVADLEVFEVPDVEAALAAMTGREQGLVPWGHAVVGTDPVGDLGVELSDGDLVVGTRPGTCELSAVIVSETAQSVTVSVLGIRMDNPITASLSCGPDGFDLRTPSGGDVTVVRVALSTPLGDRDLILAEPPARESGGGFPAPGMGTPDPVIPAE